MYEFDEVTILEESLTAAERARRKSVIAAALTEVPVSSLGDTESIEKAVEATFTFPFPVSFNCNLKVSGDVPLCSSEGQVRVYDGMMDAVSRTPEIGDIIDTEDDNSLLLVRSRNYSLSDTPVVIGREVIAVHAKHLSDAKRYSFQFSVDGSKVNSADILTRIQEAFPEAAGAIDEQSKGTVQYYEYDPDDPIRLNSGIWNFLVMNDPVMSLLYKITKYKSNDSKIELRRRNVNNDAVSLIQLADGRVGIYFTSDANNTVLRKIISSVEYYASRADAVRTMFTLLSPAPGRNILVGFDLEETTGHIDKSENIKKINLTSLDRQLRQNLNLTATMQNNYGVSIPTLKFMSERASLLPGRWVEAMSDELQADVFLFGEKGLVLPRSKEGLYPSPRYDAAIFVFVKEDGGCMLIVKKVGSKQKPTKKYNTINSRYTRKIKDSAPGKSVNMFYSCVPSTIETIVGSNYLFCAVNEGDGHSGILAACDAAMKSSTAQSEAILSSNERAVQRVRALQEELSHFFTGSAHEHNDAPYLPGAQIVDENGKYCGSPAAITNPYTPNPEALVAEQKKSGVLHKFLTQKRVSRFIKQLCLCRFAKYGSTDVEDFADKNLEETGNYPPLATFSEVITENFKGEKIPVPIIEPLKFLLRQASKDQLALDKYKSQIFLDGYCRGAASREGSTLSMPTSLFYRWRDEWTRKSDTYSMSPEIREAGYWLKIKNNLSRATNYNTFPDARAELQLLKFRNPTLITHDSQNGYKVVKKRDPASAIVGWINKENNTQIFTSVIF